MFVHQTCHHIGGQKQQRKKFNHKTVEYTGQIVFRNVEKSTLVLETEGVSLGVSYQSLCHNGNTTGLEFGVEYTDGTQIIIELMASPKMKFKSENIRYGQREKYTP